MKKNKDDFRFRFRKGGQGKIIVFNLKQIENYRVEVRCDFIAILLQQLRVANQCRINLEWETQKLCNSWIEELNDKNLNIAKTFLDIHHHLAIMDYCSHSVNLNVVQHYKTICELLEKYYSTRATK